MKVTHLAFSLSFPFAVLTAVASRSFDPSQIQNAQYESGIIYFPVTTLQIETVLNQTTGSIARRQVPAPLANGFSGYYYLISRMTSSHTPERYTNKVQFKSVPIHSQSQSSLTRDLMNCG
jgi:uncharacterized membrane protein YkvI